VIPIANPTSLAERAGASLVPSPDKIYIFKIMKKKYKKKKKKIQPSNCNDVTKFLQSLNQYLFVYW
jgi:hypothetical protein